MTVSTEIALHAVTIIATGAACWASVRVELRHQLERYKEHVAYDERNHGDHEVRLRDIERSITQMAAKLHMDNTGVHRISRRGDGR